MLIFTIFGISLAIFETIYLDNYNIFNIATVAFSLYFMIPNIYLLIKIRSIINSQY
jgi:hypothetical protein